jgi:S1-C subfamily serine protease
MAKYRIARHRSGKAEYLGGEHYWRELNKGQAQDIDWTEIRELNQLTEEVDAPHPSRLSRMLNGLIALVTLLAVFFFLISAGLPSFFHIPDISFLARSGELARDEALISLKQAVVSINGAYSSGSGFNLKSDGLIVTNRHVVEGNTGIMVTFADGRRYPARNWKYVDNYDLALAVIVGSDLPHVELGNLLPETDDPLIFIGNPLGFDWTISEATMLKMLNYGEDSIIYFSGPVRPGSSGSPLFNSSGQVVGVIFASLREVADGGLAIPAQLLFTYIED